MYDLKRAVYHRVFARLADANDGEIVGAAVTQERNMYVVWHIFANSEGPMTYEPPTERATFWFGSGTDGTATPREDALERAVDLVTRGKKRWERDHPKKDSE